MPANVFDTPHSRINYFTRLIKIEENFFDYKYSFSNSLETPNSKKWELWSEFFEECFHKTLNWVIEKWETSIFPIDMLWRLQTLMYDADPAVRLCSCRPFVFYLLRLPMGETLSSTNFHFLSLFWPLKAIETHF